MERQTLAGIMAALVAVAVGALFWRRTETMARAGTTYPRLQWVTLLATAVTVGVLAGLIVFVLASGAGERGSGRRAAVRVSYAAGSLAERFVVDATLRPHLHVEPARFDDQALAGAAR